MKLSEYIESDWFKYMDHSMRDLARQSIELLEREEEDESRSFHDYSFVVFPMAKAYEGFLKKFFLDIGLIDRRMFESKYFRIGKGLNPDLPGKYRNDEWIYGRLNEQCERQGVLPLGEEMWKAWKRSRNLLFHYFAKHKNFIGLADARVRIEELVRVMEEGVGSGLVEIEAER